jgi:two-component system, cell cycle response regulator
VLQLFLFSLRKHRNFGHQTSDQDSTQGGALRPYARIPRYGGEGFLIIASGCDGSEATALAERIPSFIGEEAINWSPQEIAITSSLGVAISGNEREDAGILIAALDEALYRAKNACRNRVKLSPYKM